MSLNTDTTMNVVPAGYGNCNNGMFGGDWGWILLFLLFGGGYGWGGFGGFGFPGMMGFMPGMFGGGNCGAPCATQADVRAAVDQQTLISKLDQQTYGLADSTYALNNTINNGFHGVDRAVCELGHQISDCCCATQRAIDGVRYDAAQQACDTRNLIQNVARDITDNQNANTRAVLDFLAQDKIATLTAENQSLKFQASQQAQNAYIAANQEAQTAELIRRLGRDCPVPAYVVPNPNCCYQPVAFNNGGCGCGQGYAFAG